MINNLVLYGSIAAASGVVGGIFFLWLSRKYESWRVNRVSAVALISGFSIMLCVIMTSTISVWYVVSEAYVFNQEGEILFDIPSNKSVWRNSLPAGAIVVEKQPMFFTSSSSLNPITSNPKVRRLSYTVTFALPIDQDAIAAYIGWSHNTWDTDLVREFQAIPPFRMSDEMLSYVEGLLYDLNEKRSKDLSEFFNPKRQSQQDEFQDLVMSEISDDLGKIGLIFIDATFSLP